MEWRRADFQLFGVLGMRWQNEKRSEEKCDGADANPGKHIHPRTNLLNFTVSWHFSVLYHVACKFETADLPLLRRRAVVTAFRRRGRAFVILFGVAVSLEHPDNLAEEAFLFLGLFLCW